MKNIINAFCNWKQEQISQTLSVSVCYWTDTDKKNIDNLTEEQIKDIFNSLLLMGESSEELNDGSICPFCIIFRYNSCVDCPYRIEHEKCNNITSDYTSIVHSHGLSIIDLIGEEKVRDKIKELFVGKL